jgi:CPA1 family monovalent cation:H+ antiporter
VRGIAGQHPGTLIGHALAVAAVTIGVRMAWTLIVPALWPFRRDELTTVPERIALGWSGMRGGVSLAAALAIPLTANGGPFPHRNEIVFLAYVAVVLTLVVPGLTLAPLLRTLGLTESDERRRAKAEARSRITHAALERLEQIAADDGVAETAVTRLRERYEARLHRLEDAGKADLQDAARLHGEMIEAEREVLRRMRRERAFPADVLRELERELDLEESRLQARA